MAIIGLLAALLLPAVSQARAAARRVQCQNHLRNVGMGVVQSADLKQRFPATGLLGFDPEASQWTQARSWVVDVLPFLEANAVAEQWNMSKQIDDPANLALSQTFLTVLTCPDDISVLGKGDLSYVVNGGVGYTVRYVDDVGDCPVDSTYSPLDLNGNGRACPVDPKTDGSPSDKEFFFKMGMFFLETWKTKATVRHHRIASVVDGMSNTVILSENVRAGADPANPLATWASPLPTLVAFYIGNPCRNAKCSVGEVDYGLSNSGAAAINAGLTSSEGSAPHPNSFHTGGAYFAFGDGRVQFVSQNINGGVYAALCSPQGMRLESTPLAQTLSGLDD